MVKNHGISDDNIIVFHYDDIANNEANPTKGVIINKPGGHDVYKGVPKDYTGEDVTPAVRTDVKRVNNSYIQTIFTSIELLGCAQGRPGISEGWQEGSQERTQ